MFLDIVLIILIEKTNFNPKRSFISNITLFALFDRVLCLVLIKLESDKFHTNIATEIRNRRNVVKCFFQALVLEPFIGVLLNFDQIGNLKNLFLALIRHTPAVAVHNWTYSVLFH